MNIGFKIYDIIPHDYQTDLGMEEAGAIVTAFGEKLDISTVKNQLHIPRNIIEAVYRDIIEIEACTVRAMKGEAKLELAEYDLNGNEIKAIVYNTIPTSLVGLKELVFNLVARDYATKVVGNYTIEQVEELRLKVYYCVDQIIKYSKSTKDGDWDFFSNQF